MSDEKFIVKGFYYGEDSFMGKDYLTIRCVKDGKDGKVAIAEDKINPILHQSGVMNNMGLIFYRGDRVSFEQDGETIEVDHIDYFRKYFKAEDARKILEYLFSELASHFNNPTFVPIKKKTE